MIVKKELPHGQISLTAIKDPATREAFMKLSENIMALMRQLSELQSAVQIIERKV